MTVAPGSISGHIQAPGDKSIAQRALILAAISDGTSELHGMPASADCLSCLQALRTLGVRSEQGDSNVLRIIGRGMEGLSAPGSPVDCGNSGTAMRLLAGLLSTRRFTSELIGDQSLTTRPMERIVQPLALMGAEVETDGGKPPLRITGPATITPIDYELPVASAQVKSAVLLAGLYANGITSVRETAVTRDHTERLLESFGCPVTRKGNRVSISGPAGLRAARVDIPGDFSSAAFMLVAGCLAAADELVINNVGINSTRTGLLDILRNMGGQISVADQRMSGGEPVATLTVRRSELTGLDVPVELVSRTIDEFPILFVAATVASGQTRFTGLGELRHKESDRLTAMTTGLRNLGAHMKSEDDTLLIKGGKLKGGTVGCAGDHRVAMALAIAGLVAASAVTVTGSECIDVSWPEFQETCKKAGVKIKTDNAGTGTVSA